MLALIVRRLIQLPFILLIIFTLTLALAWATPGSPLDKVDGRQPSEQVREAMKRQYNLDSFPRFFISYFRSATGYAYLSDWLSGRLAQEREQAARLNQPPPVRRVFDLGPSLQYEDQRVNDILVGALPVSITLGSAAMLVALAIGLVAGVIGAIKPNSLADLATLAIAMIGISLPNFVIGTELLLVFGAWMGIFPVARWGPWGAVLPTITLSLPFAAYIARLTRMGMIDVLSADFIRTARAKGVSESRVVLRHALKNAFLPVLSYLGPAAALAMTGSFVVERVFSVPGMGQFFVEAVRNKDLFLISGVVLVFSTLLIVFNLAVDVLYRWVDPRIE
ncbi:MAG: ABC transporter permease [Phycisphaerales bacterium]